MGKASRKKRERREVKNMESLLTIHSFPFNLEAATAAGRTQPLESVTDFLQNPEEVDCVFLSDADYRMFVHTVSQDPELRDKFDPASAGFARVGFIGKLGERCRVFTEAYAEPGKHFMAGSRIVYKMKKGENHAISDN